MRYPLPVAAGIGEGGYDHDTSRRAVDPFAQHAGAACLSASLLRHAAYLLDDSDVHYAAHELARSIVEGYPWTAELATVEGNPVYAPIEVARDSSKYGWDRAVPANIINSWEVR